MIKEFKGNYVDLEELPLGFINKGVCGCGATTIALENDVDTVIAVPNIALIINKLEQYPNSRCDKKILGIYSEVTDDEIKKYIINTPIKKIMVTYDSLWRVSEYIMNSNCRLVIDESDQLLSSYNLKGKKINYLYELASVLKDRVTFITATPIPLKYLPEWISELPQWEFKFKTTVCTPILMKRVNPFASLKNEIIDEINNNGFVDVEGRIIKKIIVYINSVNNIKELCKKANLKTEEVSILCGDSIENDCKIKGFNRIVNNKLTKFNFITSTGFQGIDLYDDESINIVVSCTSKNYYMVDVNTQLKQAISRNRSNNNPFKNNYIFIYNQSMFEKSEEELLSNLSSLEKRLKDNCNIINRLEGDEYISQEITNNQSKDFAAYTIKNCGKYELNTIAFNADKYFILETRRQFEKGFDILSGTSIVFKEVRNKQTTSYTTIYNAIKNKEELTEEQKECENYKLIMAYKKAFRSITENSKYCKERLEAIGDDLKSIVLVARKTIKKQRYTNKDIIHILQKIYSEYNINRKPKKTDLNELGFKFIEGKSGSSRYIEIL